MKPNLSHLQCSSVSFLKLSVQANIDFNSSEKSTLDFEKLAIHSDVQNIEGKESHWRARLKISFDSDTEENAAYTFKTELVGDFICNDIKVEEQERFVQIQGSSVLFSMAREALYDAMAKGPWPAIFLPLVSFYKSEAPSKRSD